MTHTKLESSTKFAFFDVDQTIYNGYSMRDFYLYLVAQTICDQSFKERDAEIVRQYLAKQISYDQATDLVAELQGEALKAKSVADVSRWADEFFETQGKIFGFVSGLFALLNGAGFTVYLLSAATNPTIEAIGRKLDTCNYVSSTLAVSEGVYTGKVQSMLNAAEKAKQIRGILAGVPSSGVTMGFGDSTGDIDMLSAVQHAFVINAHEPKLLELAAQKKWHVVTDTTILESVRKLI